MTKIILFILFLSSHLCATGISLEQARRNIIINNYIFNKIKHSDKNIINCEINNHPKQLSLFSILILLESSNNLADYKGQNSREENGYYYFEGRIGLYGPWEAFRCPISEFSNQVKSAQIIYIQ